MSLFNSYVCSGPISTIVGSHIFRWDLTVGHPTVATIDLGRNAAGVISYKDVPELRWKAGIKKSADAYIMSDALDIAANGSRILIDTGYEFIVANMQSGSVLWHISHPQTDEFHKIRLPKLSPDGQFVLYPQGKHTIFRIGGEKRVLAIPSTPNSENSIDSGYKQLSSYVFTKDSNYVAISEPGRIFVVELATGKTIRSWIDMEFPYASNMTFSNDGKQLYAILWTGKSVENTNGSINPSVYPITRVFSTLNDRTEVLRTTLFGHLTASPDGNVLANWNNDEVTILNAKTYSVLKKITTFPTVGGSLHNVDFSFDSRMILTSGSENHQVLWRVDTGEEVVRFIALDSGQWLISTPQGYYMASKDAAKVIGFRSEGRNYPFDQFDLKFNRPDIVLERLGYADLKTIVAYRKLYEKRLKQAGVTEAQFAPDFHTPLLKLDQKILPSTTRVAQATINLRALDDRQKLDKIAVNVNGVPTKSVDLIDKKVGEWAGAVSVELSPGRNRIQIWAVNDQKAESRKQTFEIFFDDKAFRPDLYVLTIGVGRHADSAIPTLLYASKDAIDIGAAFSAQKTRWRNIKTLNLLDTEASRESIRKVMTEFLALSRIGDTVIVYFAGHGTVTDDYYFVCYDTKKAKLEESGLAFGEIDKLLAQAPARRRLLLLDTCQSGEPDKEALGEGTAPKTIQVASKNGVTTRALDPILVDPGSGLGFSRSLEWMRELFANLDRGSGATVIGASAWQEVAIEDATKGYKNGLFAYGVLSGLRVQPTDKYAAADKNKDGIVSVSELRAWIEEVVLKESGGSQRPTVRQENLDDDFNIQ